MLLHIRTFLLLTTVPQSSRIRPQRRLSPLPLLATPGGAAPRVPVPHELVAVPEVALALLDDLVVPVGLEAGFVKVCAEAAGFAENVHFPDEAVEVLPESLAEEEVDEGVDSRGGLAEERGHDPVG